MYINLYVLMQNTNDVKYGIDFIVYVFFFLIIVLIQ